MDFAAGSTASVIHWSINEYDSMALTHGDMSLSGTTVFHNPGWVWSTLLNNLNTPAEKSEAKLKEVNYDPPPIGCRNHSPGLSTMDQPPSSEESDP